MGAYRLRLAAQGIERGLCDRATAINDLNQVAPQVANGVGDHVIRVGSVDPCGDHHGRVVGEGDRRIAGADLADRENGRLSNRCKLCCE